jgi:hypothetical protein
LCITVALVPIVAFFLGWNRQRTGKDLADPADVSLGRKDVHWWNLPDGWVISARPAHEALVSEADFIAARTSMPPAARRPKAISPGPRIGGTCLRGCSSAGYASSGWNQRGPTASENDRKVIATLGEAVAGTGRPLIITSGTGLVQSKAGQPVMETDNHPTSAVIPRAASEEAADALVGKGGNVMVMRLRRCTTRAGRAALDGISRSRRSRAASPMSARAGTECRPSTSPT